ncbi:hypothetical protein QBC41DRAFT_311409 [Cercophora samala]|uniref:RING-type E3 ubiquitin transferase n=1 Tax=Cercophora samala TaxID=330535 RepID=A0AA39ZM90_9PEZI|nr:hypothetical protein QBC41DRAFT_311409 [Cercophora samala]
MAGSQEPPISLPDDAEPADIKSQILQLTLTSIQSSDTDDNPCVICLETITSPSTALPCAHSNFDFLCLVSWLQEQPFCPLCKTGVTQVRYTDTNNQKESIYTVPSPAPKPKKPLLFDTPEDHTSTAWHNRYRRPFNRRPVTRVSSSNTPDQALERRRYIYRHNLFSLHIGSSPHTSYSPSIPPPAVLSSTPHLLSKARLFLRRELQVFFPPTMPAPSPSPTHQNREFLLEYIIALLKTVDLQSESGGAHAQHLLKDYMVYPDTGEDRTALFLHELKNWMRWRGEPPGNLSLESWDRGVQYPSLEEGRKRRREEEEQEEEGSEERGERGYSWQDEAGDHWRPGPPGNSQVRNSRRRGIMAGDERGG